jgi:hypothetical protein
MAYALLSAFLTTFVLASRLASISALQYTFIVVELEARGFRGPVYQTHSGSIEADFESTA